VEGILGSGGEGIVYRALDHHRRQSVALKVLHLEDPRSIPTLKREFRFLRDLVHPGLVPLYELVVDAELSFYAMALIEGSDFLTASRDEGALRDRLFELAETLAFLHETSRIHRDVKPTNVLVRRDGRVVLVDFGIGLDLSRQSPGRTLIQGTPRYLAPELLHFRDPSPKSDAFSVGVMLHEALLGEHPELSGRTDPSRSCAPRLSVRRPDLPADLALACERLLEPDPERRWSMKELIQMLQARTTPGGASRESGVHSRPPTAVRFSGRAVEMARLDAMLARGAAIDDPLVVVLDAPSGHGKTATVHQFLAGHPNAVALRSRCSEHELVPHKAIDGILDNLVEYLHAAKPAELAELVRPEEGLFLGQLFPEFSRLRGRGLPEVPPPSTSLGDMRALRVRAYQALARVLRRIGERETLIVAIDDLQWGDADSGKLLLEVFCGTERPRCLLLLAHRSGGAERGSCLHELFTGERPLNETLTTMHLHLRPLEPAEARDLVVKMLAQAGSTLPAQLVDRIVEEAAGSPLLLTEITSHMSRRLEEQLAAPDPSWMPGQLGIREIVAERRKQLSGTASHAFSLLCCAGSAFEVRLLAQIAKGEPDAIVHELEAARLVRQRAGGTRVEVFHDAIRESVLQTLDDELGPTHGSLAAALERDGADPAEIARHYAAAGDRARSSLWAERAADAASQSFALSHAVQMYRLALAGSISGSDELQRIEAKLADALADAGLAAEAAPMYAKLAEASTAEQAMALRARSAEQWLISGEASRGMKALEQVLRAAGLKWPVTPAAALRSLLLERTRARLAKPPRVSKPRPIPHRLRAQLDACRAAWSVSLISTIHGAANSSRYLRLALASGDHQHLALGYGMEAMYLAAAGAPARKAVARALELSRAYMPQAQAGYNRAFLLFAAGQCHYLMGDFREAVETYLGAEPLFLEACRNVSWELNNGRIFWGNALYEQGAHRELERHYASWLADADERGDTYMGAAVGVARARLTIMRTASREEALEQIAGGSARWVSRYLGFHHFSELICRSHVEMVAQRPADSLAILTRGAKDLRSSLMGRVQIPRMHFRTQTAYSAIELAADCKNASERRRLLRLATYEARGMRREQARYAVARARLVEASVRLVRSRDADVVDELRAVGTEFEQLGDRLAHAAVLARLAEIVGGDEGAGLLARARARFAEVDAADWVGTLSAFAPRFLPAPTSRLA
jgi:tetratricopeptide (TPR) repeat protein